MKVEMANEAVYLFPDTNLFIQCISLDQLDWSEWGQFNEINLIICRPVQREIDNLKHRGNSRISKRARKTYQFFRGIIGSEEKYRLVTDTSPRVKLYIESPSLPSSELRDDLDYSKSDDEIVGCLYRFKQENQDKDVRLLTHDIGPMMTAKSLGLEVATIKEEWLLPPEHNESEREIVKLKKRIAELEHAEPKFKIWLVDDKGLQVESLDLEYPLSEPMAVDDVTACIQLLQSQFPISTDFGSQEVAEKDGSTLSERLVGMKYVYSPAAEEAIAKYSGKDYPEWIKECEEVLSSLHDLLQKKISQPSFTFVVVNEGSRPGNDALINIIAEGNLKVGPPHSEDDIAEDDIAKGEDETELSLPVPPQPPKGKWSPKSPALQLLNFNKPVLMNAFSRLNTSLDLTRNFALPDISDIGRRDPNAFYYKFNRSVTPEESFSLECEQWRHGTKEECFSGQLFFDSDKENVRGALSCHIHSENLSVPTKKTVPVALSIKMLNTANHARLLIRDLLKHAK